MNHLLKALLGAVLVVAAFFAGVVVVAVAAVVFAGIYLARRFFPRVADRSARSNPHARANSAQGGASDVIDVTAIELPVDSNLK